MSNPIYVTARLALTTRNKYGKSITRLTKWVGNTGEGERKEERVTQQDAAARIERTKKKKKEKEKERAVPLPALTRLRNLFILLSRARESARYVRRCRAVEECACEVHVQTEQKQIVDR